MCLTAFLFVSKHGFELGTDEIAYRVKKEVTVDKEEVLKVCGLG